MVLTGMAVNPGWSRRIKVSHRLTMIPRKRLRYLPALLVPLAAPLPFAWPLVPLAWPLEAGTSGVGHILYVHAPYVVY